MEKFKKILSIFVFDAIKNQITDISEIEIFNMIEIPPSNIDKDFAISCFFLSKKLKKSPNEISKDICLLLSSDSIFDFEALWPYINFKLKNNILWDNFCLI